MSAGDGTPAADDGWAGYAEALGGLHRARDAAILAHRASRRADADRAAELDRLGTRLSEQQRALVELAGRLRAPLAPADLEPAAVPSLDGPTAVADLRTRMDDADEALAEVRTVASLPQLLPAWSSPFARAAVVYAGFAVPSLLLTVLLSLAGVTGNRVVLVWFVLVWPAVTALAGGALVGHVALPRLRPGGGSGDGPPAAGEPPGASPAADRFEVLLTRYAHARRRRYRWFGVLVAWASWLVPGIALDWLASLWPG